MTLVLLRLRRFLPVLLTGAYAWALSVLPAARAPGAPRLAQVLAGLALALLAGAGLSPSAGLATALGIYGFLGASALVWGLSPGGPTSAWTLLAWIAFPLAWGALSVPPARDQLDSGPVLAPRRPASRGAVAFVTIGAAAGFFLLREPDAIDRPAVRVLGLLMALVGALGLVQVSSRLGSDWQLEAQEPLRRALARAKAPLLLLAAAAALALAFHFGFPE